MDIIIKELTLNVIVGDASVANSILTQLTQLNKKVDQIMATEQQVLDAIKQIDDTTTAIGTNVAASVAVISTIDAEVKALIVAGQAQGIPDTVLQALAAVSGKLQPVMTSLNGQAASLNAIATEGVLNPIPVPPPPPPPPAVG